MGNGVNLNGIGALPQQKNAITLIDIDRVSLPGGNLFGADKLRRQSKVAGNTQIGVGAAGSQNLIQ